MGSSRGLRYEDLDFRTLYEREYEAHQETQRQLKAAQDRVVYLEAKVEKLEGDIAFLKKLFFGRRTEKAQASSDPAPASESASVGRRGAQPGHKGHPRRIPLHLPQQEVVHDLPPEKRVCPTCGLPLVGMDSEEVSYEVTFEIRYLLLRHRRRKYSRTCSCPHPIVTAPGPVKLFPKGLYAMDLWIDVLLNKYAYGLPLSRQVKKMSQEGLGVSKGGLAQGLIEIAQMLKPLYALMIERIAFEKLVHADETTWWNWASCYNLTQDSDRENPRHWMWGFFSRLYRLFVIDPSRGARVVEETLGQGEAKTVLPTLVCDRYKAYQAAGRTVAFCWAHVRRDFLKLKTKHPMDKLLTHWAETWLHLIRDLYALHRLWRGHRDTPALAAPYRDQIQTLLDRMQALLKVTSEKNPKAQQAQIESMQHHFAGLTLFLQDPDIALDNNLAERELRTPVVGRKNFYGTHSDRATEATAILYSILSTCQVHGVNPKKFLKRYLTWWTQVRGSPVTSEQVEPWLPHNYAQQYPEDLIQA